MGRMGKSQKRGFERIRNIRRLGFKKKGAHCGAPFFEVGRYYGDERYLGLHAYSVAESLTLAKPF